MREQREKRYPASPTWPGLFVMAAAFLVVTTTQLSAETLHFPQLVVGGGYTSELTLLNPGNDPVTGMLAFVLQDGSDWMFNFSDTGLASSRSITLDGKGTYRLTLSGGSQLSVGWAVFEAPGSVAGVATYEQRSGSRLVTLVSVPGTPSIEKPTVPVYISIEKDRDTGIAFANPSGTSIALQLSLFDATGVRVTSRVDTVVSRGQGARFVSELFPALDSPFQGTLVAEVEGGGVIAMAGLSMVEGLFGGLPVANFSPSASGQSSVDSSGPFKLFVLNRTAGWVVSDPSGIDCNHLGTGPCIFEFPAGTRQVVLRATPREGDTFEWWRSPSACRTSGETCTVTYPDAWPASCFASQAISADTDRVNGLNICDQLTVEAVFATPAPPVSGGGGGTGGSSGSWRFCDVTCSACPTGVPPSLQTSYSYRYYSTESSRTACVNAYNFCVAQRCERSLLNYYN